MKLEDKKFNLKIILNFYIFLDLYRKMEHDQSKNFSNLTSTGNENIHRRNKVNYLKLKQAYVLW